MDRPLEGDNPMASVRLACLSVISMIVVASCVAFAQQPLGVPAFGAYRSLYGVDTISLGNLNVHLQIPIYSKSGHGIPFAYSIVYDTEMWNHANGSAWQAGAIWKESAPTDGAISYTQQTVCSTQKQYSTFSFVDTTNTSHTFAPLTLTSGGCNGTQTSGTTTSTDGYSLFFNATNLQYTVTTPSGLKYGWNGSAWTLTDRNGNQISEASPFLTFTDTLGTTALTRSARVSPATYTYTGPTGAQTINATWTSSNLTSNASWPCASGSVDPSYLLTALSFPDGRSYSLLYDSAGRITNITLPTGGTITYNYNGPTGGMNCDGSTSGMTITTPDGTWTYTHTISGSTGTTTEVDPIGNRTVITFYQASGMTAPYETSRVLYNSAGALVETIYTCYNGATSPSCPTNTVSVPITSRYIYSWLGAYGANPSAFSAETYNSAELLARHNSYDYFNGSSYPLIRQTLISYASLGSNILDRPAQITVEDASNTIVAQTTFSNYDSHGNVGTVSRWVSPTQNIVTNFAYFWGGNIQTITDPNGAQTIFTDGACNGAFVTAVSLPMNLSTSQNWDCNGAVETIAYDVNNVGTQWDYSTQPVWRIHTITDADGVINARYNSVNDTELYRLFNGNQSIVDSRVVLDSMGRVSVSQAEQAPASNYYDTVESDYDEDGRQNHTTLPYQGTAGQTNGAAPRLTTIWDALNRPYQQSDASGAVITSTYQGTFALDVFSALTPTPVGEANHNKQYEYDGLGRLISVCEITGAVGSGTCGQSVPQTGYWTKYTYDSLDRLVQVRQNAQGTAQVRTFTYDGLGRLLSETHPESGTTTYYYDSPHGSCGATYDNGSANSPGDLTLKVDANGNNTCFYYDLLHRLTDAGITGGVCRHFRYDAATYNGQPMANAKSRLAEAKTEGNCSLANWTITSDDFFSYDLSGRLQTVYQWSTHSGGYYQSSVTYAPSGEMNSYSTNLVGLPTFTATLDGEGRISSISASSGQNPLTNIAYSVSGGVTVSTFGSGDADSYTYDPNSNRMTGYTFDVGGQNITGTLSWNANGSLQAFTSVDPFNALNNQTCSFLADDLTRLSSVSCGSKWSQAFSYDAFGNITKSGSSAWQPGYNASNNRYTLSGTSYDAAGNLLNDTFHTYVWDNWGSLASVDGTPLITDALGRTVEIGVTKQVVYGPAGKLALMNGQVLSQAFIVMPSGAQAVYNSSGLAFYRHVDWLGSSRFTSTPNRTCASDSAFAPYGENYSSACGSDLMFTGQTQDTVSGLYDFLYRRYAPVQGRWISPDPAGLSAADLSNPQSWNRYAYVASHPLTAVDPSGLVLIELSWTGGSGLVDSDVLRAKGFDIQFDNNGDVSSIEPPASPISLTDDSGHILATIGPDSDISARLAQLNQSMTISDSSPSGNPISIVRSTWVFRRDAVQPFGRTAANRSADPILDARANALAQAINQTGVQSLGNPCTVGLWYAGSVGGALLLSSTEVGGTLFPETKDAIDALKVWYSLATPEVRKAVRLASQGAAFAVIRTVQGCNSFQ